MSDNNPRSDFYRGGSRDQAGVSVHSVGRAMEALLVREGRPVVYRDRATGEDLTVSPTAASAPNGLLPALVVAGEAVWREATGKGFGLDIVRDPQAFLGYRLRAIREGSFSTVMLSTMEATAQVAQPAAFMVHDLNALWQAATNTIERQASALPSTGHQGAAP